MLIDRKLLENYITSKLPFPGDLIFIADYSAIFPREGTLTILTRIYPIVFFENVLQLRDALERHKDNLSGKHPSREEPGVGKQFCIISQKSEEEEIPILDYIFRSNYLKVTPKDILEFVQSGYQWMSEVNQLHGQDFWEAFELLTQFRLKLDREISPTDCAHVVLSALLDVDLTGELSNRDAIELWRGLDEDENLISEKYPRLWRILSRRVRATIPMMEKLEGDVDFVYFLWTMNSLDKHHGNYDLFLPHIFGDRIWQKYANTPISDIKQFCSDLIKNDARRVIEQIKRTEFWLTQDSERLRLFDSCVGVDEIDIQSTAEFAATERTFCVSIQEALRYLAKRLCLSPDLLEPRLLNYVLHNIKSKHLFQQDNTTYLRIRDTFEAFSKLIELIQILREIEGKNWLQENEIQLRFSLWGEIYSKYFSKLEYLIDRLKLLNFRCELLPEVMVNQISEKVDELFANYNEAFARLVQSRYTHWVAGAKDSPLLGANFLDTLFMPFYEEYIRTPTQYRFGSPAELNPKPQSAFIIIFDGMRWDGWNTIKTRMLQTFGGKLALEKTVPLLSILPTTTEFSRCALVSGLFPSEVVTGKSAGVDDWRELLSLAFAKRQINEVQAITVHEQNLNQLVQLIEDSEVKVKVINFTLFDNKLHRSRQNLSTLYEEVLVNFDDIIQPCLERIPSDSLVFIFSDHGLIETKGKAQPIPLEDAEVRRRYFGLKHSVQSSDMPKNIVFFDTDDIKIPRNSGIVQYGFATSNTPLMIKDISDSKGDGASYPENLNKSFTSQRERYVHGGISMQEMIVPCSIFVPKGEGQLELWTKWQVTTSIHGDAINAFR